MSSQDNLPLIDTHAPPTRHPSSPTETSATLGGDSGFLSNPDSEPETRRKKPRFEPEYRKDREEWSDTAIACLLEAYTEKFNQLNRGNLRGRDWEEVAEAVSERCGGGGGGGGGGGEKQKMWKSVEQCKNKIDNLKKRYKVELQRISSGGGSSSWHWFKQIEAVMGNSGSSSIGKALEGEDRNGGSSLGKQANKRYVPNNVASGSNLKSKSIPSVKWRRVVFKISGTALSGNCQSIDPKIAMQIAREIATACRLGVQVAIVVGGRNFFCGDSWVSATGFDRPTAYQIGMMASVMNSMLIQSALEKLGVQTRMQSAFVLPEVAEPYSRPRAIRHLEKGKVVIFGGIGAGTGNPLFTTDTAAALRATEINADVLLKGTNVDGVYDCHSDNGSATLDHISFREVGSIGITSMDTMAITYCEENTIPVVVFNLLEPGNISKALCGERVGTLIDQEGRIS
ncbi:Aspartate/glutamate/uridylate kinase [Corchorus capsularis]|uniref:UMP kinase n=1 Tax=Corchorus capsularis TaxID=210143 RepID=A0A1R3JPI5_COCAP|nr:Aspartate/glutamate/uridylate kinase [Corchorus capsularis]